MKQLSRLAAASALAAGALFSSVAMASPTCQSALGRACEYQGDYTYVGSLDATQSQFTAFDRILTGIADGTALSDHWVFDLNPVAGVAQLNANFIRFPTGVTGFTVYIRNVLNAGTCTTVETLCTGTTTDNTTDLAVGTPTSGGNVFIDNTFLGAGRYVFIIVGTIHAPAAQNYNGNVSTALPEPGSLALAGLALVGAAAGLRRSRKA